MSKQTKEQNSVNPGKKTPQQAAVQKVVNQRYTNGKKQYKVIWAGRPFQEATWVEEQKLNCPDKISEFLKRYQQVMKKKNLQSKIQPQTLASPSQMKLESTSKPQSKKLILEKPNSGTQQKLVLNQSVILNKQKLQASLYKNNIIPTKYNPITDSPPQTSKGINIYTSSQKELTQTQIENHSNLLQIISNQTLTKSEKNHENDQKESNQNWDANNKPTKSSKRVELAEDFEEDTAETNDQFSLSAQQQIFIDSTERLDIEKISGMILDFEGELFHKQSRTFLNQINGKDQTPTFFMVKNKFSDEQKLISRERMVNEEPLKLIEYYESLLQESQQQEA